MRRYYIYNGTSFTDKMVSVYWGGLLGTVSVSEKTYYHMMSWCPENAGLVVWIIVLLLSVLDFKIKPRIR